MALPQNVKIPRSTAFGKLQDGLNRFRFLSDVVVGWEGWKNQKPFRHKGDVCQIKPEEVDLNKNGKPNINYFWAAIVWNCNDKQLQILEITQKTIMGPLLDLEQNSDWGDLKLYDITINKKKEGDKTSYTVLGIPPKPVDPEIQEAYQTTDIKLEKLFEGGYVAEEIEEDIDVTDVNFG